MRNQTLRIIRRRTSTDEWITQEVAIKVIILGLEKI